MQAVHKMQFQGRVLSARFAKEGAEPARYAPALGEKQLAISSAESFQSSGGASGLLWGDGSGGEGGEGGRGRSESKSETEAKEGDAETVAVASRGETKRSGVMSAPAVVDGSSSRGSHGKDKRHRN